MKFLILVFMASAMAWAQPKVAPLPDFAEPPTNPVDTTPKADPACGEIVARLEAYNAAVRQNDQAVLAFLDQVSTTASDWHSLLEPLEGQTVVIPTGQFKSLKEYSSKIGQVTSWAYDNSAYFAEELDKIIVALRGCQL